jgi:hypothetical protein
MKLAHTLFSTFYPHLLSCIPGTSKRNRNRCQLRSWHQRWGTMLLCWFGGSFGKPFSKIAYSLGLSSTALHQKGCQPICTCQIANALVVPLYYWYLKTQDNHRLCCRLFASLTRCIMVTHTDQQVIKDVIEERIWLCSSCLIDNLSCSIESEMNWRQYCSWGGSKRNCSLCRLRRQWKRQAWKDGYPRLSGDIGVRVRLLVKAYTVILTMICIRLKWEDITDDLIPPILHLMTKNTSTAQISIRCAWSAAVVMALQSMSRTPESDVQLRRMLN